MQGWNSSSLSAVTATGNVTQLYPTWVPAGNALPVSPMGTLRRPQGGRLGQISIETDSTNGGILQIYDIDGLDAVADVSSLTVITNTQLSTLITAGKASLIWAQNFAASPANPAPWSLGMGFLRGLAARFVATAGSCNLNIIAEGGYSSAVVPCGYVG